MMFSSEDIRQALDSGELVIEPFNPKTIRPSGITLHLGETLLRPIPGKVVDVKAKVVPDYETIKLTMEKPYLLEPNGFVLGATYESVTVGDKLGFLIEGRSTLARVGLTIVQTAMLVYPGHRKRAVTLEVATHGPNAILLYPKMKIARVVLLELKSPTQNGYDKSGKYRTQADVGPPVFENEFMDDE